MKIQDSKELRDLSAMCAMPVEALNSHLITALCNKGIIGDDSDYYGMTVTELCEESEYGLLALAIEVCKNVPIHKPGQDCMDASYLLGALTVIGDGPCPLCGGDCVEIDGEYAQVGGDGWNTEPEYEPIWQGWRCEVCGHTFSTGYEADPDERHDRKMLNE